jgi:hypothetical protein
MSHYWYLLSLLYCDHPNFVEYYMFCLLGRSTTKYILFVHVKSSCPRLCQTRDYGMRQACMQHNTLMILSSPLQGFVGIIDITFVTSCAVPDKMQCSMRKAVRDRKCGRHSFPSRNAVGIVACSGNNILCSREASLYGVSSL